MSKSKKGPQAKARLGQAPARARNETPKRKNYRLCQSKIDRARKILRTRTETETIEQALDLVAFGERLLAGVDRMRGKKLLYSSRRDEG